jgi:hypothetical protein
VTGLEFWARISAEEATRAVPGGQHADAEGVEAHSGDKPAWFGCGGGRLFSLAHAAIKGLL